MTMTLGQMRDDYTLQFSLTTSLSRIYAEWSSLCSLKDREKAFLNTFAFRQKRNDMFTTLLAAHRRVVLKINVVFFPPPAARDTDQNLP